jgi:putative ABC transport system permease protein
VLLRDSFRHPLQATASILGISLGLAVMVAVHSAGQASRDSFTRSFEAVAGRATLQLVGVDGVAPDSLGRLLSHPLVEAVQPVIEGVAPVLGHAPGGAPPSDRPGEPPLKVLGLDPLRIEAFLGQPPEGLQIGGEGLARFLTEPGLGLVPAGWAKKRGLKAGDRIAVAADGRRKELEILAVLPPGLFPEATRDLALVDLATADELFGRGGRLDRVDIIAASGADLSASLVPGERLDRPAQRGERAGKLMDAFRLNLLALSGLALLVGCYLVFNAAEFTVVRRSPLLGQLRCLGATRPALLGAVLLELALHGLVGALLGLIGGRALAQLLVADLSRTVSTLYGFVDVDSVEISPTRAAAYVGLALLVALVAGFLPARDAAWTPPRFVGFRAAAERRFARAAPRLVVIAVAALAVTTASLNWPTRATWPGYVSAAAVLIAAGALVPPAMLLLLPRLRRLCDRWGRTWGSLAAGEVERGLSRTGAATSALTVSLAMALGIMTMVSSFEREVVLWLDTALRSDLYLSPVGQDQAREDGRIADGAVTLTRSLPEARSVELLRGSDALLDDRLIRVIGVEGRRPEQIEARAFLQGEPERAIEALLGGATLISEPLSTRFDLHLGDRLQLEGRSGPVSYEVAGVFRDFAMDRGYAMLAGETYTVAFGDTGVLNMAVALKEGADASGAAERLRELLASPEGGGPHLVEVVANSALREQVRVAFDQTFAVTYLLQTIATSLALVGIAATLLSLFLERLRELATLRALGASLRSVAGLFVAQGLLIAGVAAVAAIPVGAALAWLLVSVINLRSFGWSIRLSWPWADVLSVCALALLAGLLASLAPWVLARRTSVASALREE